MLLRPPTSTLTDTLVPYTTLVRSKNLNPYHAGDATHRSVSYLCTPAVSAHWKVLSTTLREAKSAARRGVVAWCRIMSKKDKIFERSEEHTSELQSLMRISYAVFCLKKKNK